MEPKAYSQRAVDYPSKYKKCLLEEEVHNEQNQVWRWVH